MVHLSGSANRLKILFHATVLLLGGMVACVSPLEIDTPREWITNIDSLITTPGVINGIGDSLNARVNGSQISFAALVERPFHNGELPSGHYLTVRAATQLPDGDEYQVVSLRLDRVSDTGVYRINGPYSAPRDIDTLGPPVYGAQYLQKRAGGFPAAYVSDGNLGGEIHVVRIDTVRRVMVGTFWFRGYSADRDETIDVDRGVFRLALDVR
jgi:hypothetical protein